jgi:hypothetical protein
MRRWLALLCGVLLLAVLAACEVGTPPPIETRPVEEGATPTPVPPSPTPIPWPDERFVFSYLEKVWLADGAAPRVLTVGQDPALSPDGQQVAYLLTVSPTLGTRQVYVLDLPTSRISLVSGPPDLYGPPAWAPDGSLVAYTYQGVLVVTDPQGTTQRPVVTDVGALGSAPVVPAWAQGGQVIVCPLTRVGTPELFAVRLADGEGVRVSYTGGYSVTTPFVVTSANTALIPQNTVLYVNPADGGSVWAAALDGSGRQRILPALDHVVGPLLLSDDGTRLAGLRQLPGQEGYALWVVDLMIDKRYDVGSLPGLPDLFHWSKDGRTLYWIVETGLYRYTVAAGQGQAIAALPPPTATPTPTPLPVEQRLVYYAGNTFYRAKPYVAADVTPKAMNEAYAVPTGYALHGNVVVYPREADLYRVELSGGVPQRFYTLQSAGLGLVDLAWSLQGNALLYAATYQEGEITPTRRVDLGLIRLQPSGREVLDVNRFTSFTVYSGTMPLLYDETTKEAYVVPWNGNRVFNRMDIYNLETGEIRSVSIAGEGAAMVSEDRHWIAATAYDTAAGHGLIRIYDLTVPGPPSQTYALPDGTFAAGPLRWSPDGGYVAFIAYAGTPAEVQRAEGIWVLRPNTLEVSMVVPVDDPEAYLVGWEIR